MDERESLYVQAEDYAMDIKTARNEGRLEGCVLTLMVVGATIIVTLYVFGFIL